MGNDFFYRQPTTHKSRDIYKLLIRIRDYNIHPMKEMSVKHDIKLV